MQDVSAPDPSNKFPQALVHPGVAVPTFGLAREAPADPVEQESFYVSHFRPAFIAGAPLDVGKETGYVLRMRAELAGTVGADPTAPRELRRLLRAYGRPSREIAETYFLEGDFAGGYAAWGRRVPLSVYVNLASSLGHPRLNALTVFYWAGNHLTRRGVRGLEDVMDRLQAALDTFHDTHGHSIIEHYWTLLTAPEITDELLQEIPPAASGELDPEAIRQMLSEVPGGAGSSGRAFRGEAALERPIDWPEPWVELGARYGLLRAKSRQLVRSAENDHRAGAGVPLVGQGWVSEMTLLREMQAAFPDERVVHQARPGWLGRQSIDIFFPDRMLAIEYQGAQHSQPVDFFGGEAAFNAQRERDATKRALCATAGCRLIEVFPGYNLRELIGTVTIALESQD